MSLNGPIFATAQVGMELILQKNMLEKLWNFWLKTQPEYNETAIKMGVKKIIRKDYKRLEKFAADLLEEIKSMIEGH